jgi:hypothetical protein
VTEKNDSSEQTQPTGDRLPASQEEQQSKEESLQPVIESQPLPNTCFEQIPLQKPETENMEVHKHPHHVTHKKKWGEYLLEFLMLFLAVFLGFIAENQREHGVEKNREKQFMQTFLVDLQRDTAEIIEDSGTWERVINDIDSLRKELEKPEDSQNVALMYKASTTIIFRYTTFRYNDRTIQQLRNSGNFRLIDKVISDSMLHYDGTARTSIPDREIIIRDIYLDLNHLQNSLLNSGITDQIRKKKIMDNMVYPRPIQNKNNLYQYYNDLFFYKVKVEDLKRRLMDQYRSAVNLMKLVKQTYHLE